MPMAWDATRHLVTYLQFKYSNFSRGSDAQAVAVIALSLPFLFKKLHIRLNYSLIYKSSDKYINMVITGLEASEVKPRTY